MAVTIAILSQKGGTGKTTLTRSLAEGLSLAGLATLAVDCDPQANLSEYFGVPGDAFPTLGEVVTGQATAMEAIHGPVLPANLGLAEAELILAGKAGREFTFRNALREPKRKFDVILLDCPPTLGLLTVNALVASDRAILSTEAEFFSGQGAEQANEVVEIARENLNPSLDLLGVLVNIVDPGSPHSRDTREDLIRTFGERLFETEVVHSTAYPESAKAARSIFDFDPARAGDYADLTVEVLERLGIDDALERARSLAASIPRFSDDQSGEKGRASETSPGAPPGRSQPPALDQEVWMG